MPISESDPRVFFASERTLLAWVRTGITIIGLGFVVSRFGLFLNLMIRQSAKPLPSPHYHSLSSLLGVAFVIIGTVVIAVAAIQHRRYTATLVSQDLPEAYSKNIAVLLALAISVLGVFLAVYLLFTPS